jgi:hypothetical protein
MAQYVAVRALNRSSQVRVVQADNEVQKVKVNATSGQFKLTFSGQQTGNIAFDALASTVQTALEALSNIAVGDVKVTGGPGNSGGTTPYFVTFRGALGDTDVPTLTGANGSSVLSGGGASITITVDTPGVNGGRQVKLTPTVDTVVDLDRATNRRALAHHSAYGQFIVSATNANDGGTALPANS